MLVIINPNGQPTTISDPSQPPYDGADDVVVGVLNESGRPVGALTLTGFGVFGLDGDGLCVAVAGAPAGPPRGCPFGPTGYEGPGTSISATDDSDGTISFSGGLPPGGTAYFSLEGVPYPPPFKALTHFRVEVKAWIPQALVVNPANPIDNTTDPAVPPCVDYPALTDTGDPFGLPARVFSTFTSRFNGNDHTGYDGSFKVLMPIEFDWDGSAIQNFQIAPETHIGQTVLYITQKVNIRGIPPRTFQCSVTDTAQDTVGNRNTGADGNQFTAQFTESIPLVPGAPPIFDAVRGAVQSDGSLTLTINHTAFPSHGVRVIRDGTPLLTEIYNDVSCLSPDEVTGVGGAARIAVGLTLHIADTINVPITPTFAPTIRSVVCGFADGAVWFPRGGLPSEAVDAQASAARGPLPLAVAIRRGLVRVSREGAGEILTTTRRRPISVVLRGNGLTFAALSRGPHHRAGIRYYGPLNGRVTLQISRRGVSVFRGGHPVRSRRADRRPPRTRLKVKHHGRSVILRLSARDNSRVAATYVVIGRRTFRVRAGRLRLRLHGATVIAYYSIDAFGNMELPRIRTLRP